MVCGPRESAEAVELGADDRMPGDEDWRRSARRPRVTHFGLEGVFAMRRPRSGADLERAIGPTGVVGLPSRCVAG